VTARTRQQQTTDALIARGLADAQTSGRCPEPDVLGAFHDRTLDADETDRWLAHVADCQRCQTMLAAVGRAAGDMGADTRGSMTSPWWRWRVLAPLSALSIVVLAVWIVDPVVAPGSRLDRRVVSEAPQTLPQTQRASAATATTEPTEPRRVPSTTGAPLAVLESANTAATPTDPILVRDIDTAPQTPAAIATPPVAAASARTPDATGDATRRPEAPARVRSNDSAPAAAPLLEVTRFAAVEANPLQIVSPDLAARWRVAPGGPVEHSVDGGATWQIQTSPTERVIAGSAPTDRVAWLVGENGFVLRTIDGERWERTTAPAVTRLTSIDAVDRLDATVATADGRRFRTVDGGARWVRLP